MAAEEPPVISDGFFHLILYNQTWDGPFRISRGHSLEC